MVIIHPKLTKFSSIYCKGSVLQRAKFAERINNKIFSNTLNLYKGKSRNVHVELIEDCYNFCLPEDKNILLAPLDVKSMDDYYGGIEILEKLGIYVGYMIDLPVSKSLKFNIKNFPALMHESTHILDYLLNPKYLVNDRDLNNIAPDIKNLLNVNESVKTGYKKIKKILDMYNDVFYKIEDSGVDKFQILKNAEKKLRKGVEGLDSKTKIVLLKYMRNSMIMEQHAYKQDVLYARILKKLGRRVDSEDLKDYNKIIMFPEKIKIVEKILIQTINSEREKFSAKI